MRVLFFILSFFIHPSCFSCSFHHIYDENVVKIIEFEGDTYCDDHLYDQNLKAQMIYGMDAPDPKKYFSKLLMPSTHFAIISVWKKLKNMKEPHFPLPMIFHLQKKN